MIGQRLKIETKGLAKEQVSTSFVMVRTIFNLILFFIALSGLVGIIVFSFVHWA